MFIVEILKNEEKYRAEILIPIIITWRFLSFLSFLRMLEFRLYSVFVTNYIFLTNKHFPIMSMMYYAVYVS